MPDVLKDTLFDTLKLIPFLFLTYLLMEFIEHKTSDKATHFISKAGKFGPVLGGVLGIVPQCGFSASAASLYSGRVITAGTMVAIFLSTSDEMLPVCISSQEVPTSVIVRILLSKVVIGVIFGIAIDIILRITHKNGKEMEIHSICEHDHCHCEEGGILKSTLHHTLQITIFILLISFAINTIIHFLGEDKLESVFTDAPFAGCAIAAAVGLIPNCAASVIITELFIKGIISTGAMMAGLLTGCGIGLLVLFKTNKKIRENIGFAAVMYAIGLVAGMLFELMNISF